MDREKMAGILFALNQLRSQINIAAQKVSDIAAQTDHLYIELSNLIEVDQA